MRSILPLFAVALAASAPVLATETINVPGFRGVELRGGGVVTVVPGSTQRVTIEEGSSQFTRMHVTADGKLRIDTCNEQCPQHYQLQVVIQSPRVPDLAVSGGGLITTAGGFAPQSEVAAGVAGGGKIDLRSVDATTAAVGINGGGLILVRARSTLAAGVNGGGEVRYVGNPRVTMGVSGGGLVRRDN